MSIERWMRHQVHAELARALIVGTVIVTVLLWGLYGGGHR